MKIIAHPTRITRTIQSVCIAAQTATAVHATIISMGQIAFAKERRNSIGGFLYHASQQLGITVAIRRVISQSSSRQMKRFPRATRMSIRAEVAPPNDDSNG